MRKTAAVMAVAIALAGARIAPVAAGEAGFEDYVVRPGDTLSGIAGRALGDAARWREILRDNPQVTNPNMIFPGDTLRIAVPTVAAAEADVAKEAAELEARAAQEAEETAAAEAARQAELEAAAAAEADAARAAEAATVAQLPVEVVRPAPEVNPGLARAAGYIAEGLPAVAIVASPEGRALLGPGDQAIVNAPLELGMQYTVVRGDRRVFHPLSGQPLGWLVQVLGTAEVICPGERCTTVVFRSLRDAATVGDYLVPGEPGVEQLKLPAKGAQRCVAPGGPDAVIVAMDENRLSAGEQEIVYIDRGTAQGVGPGARFQAFRQVAPAGSVMVGELLVLRAGPETATALVTNSLRELQVADLLRSE